MNQGPRELSAAQNVTRLKQALAGLIPPERLIDEPIRLLAYGTDASFYRLVPKLVVRVVDEQEVIALLKHAHAKQTPVTFRAAGTSLSGQAITDSVLAVLEGKAWRRYAISESGDSIRLQPGIIGAQANKYLAPLGRKIGPDPASIGSAKIGGIAANNASGMCCGVAQNSYQTLQSMRVILADGALLDTASEASRRAFAQSHAEFMDNSRRWAQTREDPDLAQRIRHKFKIKNTTGYSLNALVDFEDPVRYPAAPDDRLGRDARFHCRDHLPHGPRASGQGQRTGVLPGRRYCLRGRRDTQEPAGRCGRDDGRAALRSVEDQAGHAGGPAAPARDGGRAVDRDPCRVRGRTRCADRPNWPCPGTGEYPRRLAIHQGACRVREAVEDPQGPVPGGRGGT